MSNSIDALMTSIRRNGMQPSMLYSCTIFDANGTATSFDTHLLDITLPGPKYQFYNNTFWKGNWEYRQPAGIKFEDQLIMVVMVPGKEIEGSNNIFSFLKKNRQKFSYPGNGGSFYWKGPLNGDTTGYNIQVYPLNWKGTSGTPYVYTNCFIERILPFKFSVEPEPAYQTMSIAWTVGAEINRL